MINKLAITGGTHGNELTGVYLIKKWKLQPELLKRSNFETLFLHTNKKAIEEVRRFIDKKRIKCFSFFRSPFEMGNAYEPKQPYNLSIT